MEPKRRKKWSPPPLEVGDRVKHQAKDAMGVIKALNGTTATVEISGESFVVDVAGLSYFPSREQIWKCLAPLLRRSRKKKSIRRALGLPPFIGVRDETLAKPTIHPAEGVSDE